MPGNRHTGWSSGAIGRIWPLASSGGSTHACLTRAATASGNGAERPPATHLLVVRHQNRPGVLAHVIGALGRARINIQDMENMIYEGGEAACARMNLSSEPSQAVMEEVRKKEEIIGVDLTAVG